MYGLNINFLKDRPEYRSEPSQSPRRRDLGTPESKRPIWLGGITGLGLVGLAAGGWLFLQSQNEKLVQRQAELDAEISAIKTEQARLASVRTQTRQAKEDTAAFASVFNTIKPWSATFGDISARTPPKVRILGIKELTAQEISALPKPSPAAPSPSPSPTAGTTAPAPPPSGMIQIIGTATSFNDVNDFLLILQRSKFVKSDTTRIVGATLNEPKSPPAIQVGGASPAGDRDKIKLPGEVAFVIQTELTDVPASELLQELESKKATGLVTRIESLRQKGVVKP
ncbi:PilN domain-containing protein [Phormidium sp. CLA17]|uniref:PilN domain-containing protein n=1 Tax=Leptolyngbya sp. Cla-17 TaxID=2803751 RepID=UPI001491466F|nr:PilN domain-containing protein [Leptolyngbya sp. Cla-17]MBM0742383.1 PilN domain-containing protein [Leptolyngbya sp. Cla-17]